MPAEIETAYTYRTPSWHLLGTVSQEMQSAIQAYLASGKIDVFTVPVPGIRRGTLTVIPPYKTIVRGPTENDQNLLAMGVVGKDYVLINPEKFVRLWDNRVKRYVETLGILKQGRVMFITTKLPTFDVKGDEVENYLLARNGMDGTIGVAGSVTPVRVVCANTLALGERKATETFRMKHSGNVIEQLGDWLENIVAHAERTTKVLQEAFDVLASTRAKPMDVQLVLNTTYPDPKGRPDNGSETAAAVWQAAQESQAMKRLNAFRLYSGEGVGSTTPAAAGTLWGVWNAIVDLSDYSRTGNKRSDANAPYDALFGNRADDKARAFEACLAVARN